MKTWSIEEEESLSEYKQQGIPVKDMMKAMNEKYGKEYSYWSITKKLGRLEHIQPLVKEGKMFPNYVYDAHKEFVHVEDKIKRMTEIHKVFEDKKCYILSLSDVHSPLIDFKMIENVLRKQSKIFEEKKKQGYTTVIMLNGDIFDFPQMSKFAKGKHRVNIKAEVQLATELINIVCKMADYVVAILGNHDARLFAYIARKAESEPEMIEYMEENLDPLKKIKHDNFLYLCHNKAQIGGMVFVHPFGYNKPILKTAENMKNAIVANKAKLPNPNKIQGVCMGHTHQIGMYIENEVMIMEQGHSSHEPDYKFERDTSRAWVKGYAIIQLDEEGNIDYEETRPIPYVV